MPLGAASGTLASGLLATAYLLDGTAVRLEQGSVERAIDPDEQLLAGWLRLGHEVRTFMPCGQDAQHWIVGESAALDAVFAGYRELACDAEPYAPVFMVGTDNYTRPPTEGFGADCAAAVDLTRLFEIRLEGNCGR